MIHFTALVKKFDQHGDKAGWTYIEVPSPLAEQLMPGNKRSFRVKGKLDSYTIEGVSLLPMGNGDFILPLNNEMRKHIGKGKGAELQVKLQADKKEYKICAELVECLQDEPRAWAYFNQLAPSHQKYYSKWIDSAKTEPTKAKRIALTVTAMSRGMSYGEMMREQKSLLH